MTECLSTRVLRSNLKGPPNNGLVKTNVFGRIRDRVPFINRKRVNVQAARFSTEDRILYLPGVSDCESPDCESRDAEPTQFVKVDPRSARNLVYREDEFDVSFIGMSAVPHDLTRQNNNELLLYSLIRQNLCTCASQEQPPPAPSPGPSTDPQPAVCAAPTGISATDDMPFIHYDPVVDGHDEGTLPDSFVPIPASKRIYYKHAGGRNSDTRCQHVFNVRITLLEIDKISDILARAPTTVDPLGSYVSSAAPIVPYINLVAMALSFASELGKHGIKKHARPDHVMSADKGFLVAQRAAELPQERECYLQYGYYFFLSKPMDTQTYVQTCSSSQHMTLLLKREKRTWGRWSRNEK